MQLEVQRFIKDHPSDWEKTLSEKPYFVSTTRDEVFGRKLVMLKYTQFGSDFNIPLVRECRGLILDESDGFSVVSYAFNKFGNYGERYCPEIDRSTMTVSEKIDGSLMKLVKLDNTTFLISTNGTIDAFKAPVTEQLGCGFKSFGEIFKSVLDAKVSEFGNGFLSEIEVGHTYMFEMVSPWTRVVVPYQEPNLYLIGVRDNHTFKEVRFDSHPLSRFFDTPRVFRFGTFEDCVKSSASLPWDDEGYVVMDSKFNRVKVKSAAWLTAHHLSNNNSLSYSRAFDLIRRDEVGEVLCYFPNFKEKFDECRAMVDELAEHEDGVWRDFVSNGLMKEARKAQAEFILANFRSQSCGFALLDGRTRNAVEFFHDCPLNSLLKTLGIGG